MACSCRQSPRDGQNVEQPLLPRYWDDSVCLTGYRDRLVGGFRQLDVHLGIAIHACAGEPLCDQVLGLMDSKTLDVQIADERQLDRAVQAYPGLRLVVRCSIEVDRQQIPAIENNVSAGRIENCRVGGRLQRWIDRRGDSQRRAAELCYSRRRREAQHEDHSGYRERAPDAMVPQPFHAHIQSETIILH